MDFSNRNSITISSELEGYESGDESNAVITKGAPQKHSLTQIPEESQTFYPLCKCSDEEFLRIKDEVMLNGSNFETISHKFPSIAKKAYFKGNQLTERGKERVENSIKRINKNRENKITNYLPSSEIKDKTPEKIDRNKRDNMAISNESRNLKDSESRKSILKLVSKPKSSKAKIVKFNIGLSQDSHSSQTVLSSSSFDSESEETNNQQKKLGEGQDFVNHNIDLIDKYAEHFDEWVDEIEEECTNLNIDQEKHKDDTFTLDLEKYYQK